MRETNINEDIAHRDIKVGDTIVVSRKVTVKSVRETTIHAGVGKDRKPITIVGTDTDTIGIAETESVTLLERDKEPLVTIPLDAIIITWRDDYGYDYIARRDKVSDEWVTSSDGPNTTYTTDALVKAIEDDDFDGYQEGSFEVLRRKPHFATGGYVHGLNLSQPSIDALNRIASQRIVSTSRVERTNRSPITGYPLVP